MKNSVKNLLQSCLDSALSFVSYREPSAEIVTIIQKDLQPHLVDEDIDISEQRGFVFSPYAESDTCRKIIISPDIVIHGNDYSTDTVEDNIFAQGYLTETDSCLEASYACEELEYSKQVDKIIGAIEGGCIEKAVLSRLQLVSGDQRKEMVRMYMDMCDKYPHSFVYVLRAGGQLWLGATPEILATMTENYFSTIALAATRVNSSSNKIIENWSDKEKQEQQYVTDYIFSCLKKHASGSLEQGKRYVRQAANLLHLCTEFTCSSKDIFGHLSELLNNLHPTPAVCGMPKEKAKSFLNDLENHDRQYYAGYLGPVNILSDKISLYVNLRCMRVCADNARVFVGGGITADSVAKEEWQETVMKSKTILSVLN